MGLGNDLIGDLEHLLTQQTVRRQSLFRMIGVDSQCWRAERDLERMYPGMRCLLLPSATIGLSLLLETLGLEPGQEVLITPFGWLSNWSCISRAGLTPRFLPLNDQLQLDPEQVAERITERTGAVIVTHLMGRGQQAVGDIARLCGERRIPLLEDIAQSFGVSIGKRRAGTFGTAAWCSLNHHKILSTGDGGFILARDEKLFAQMTALHDQGCVLQDGKRQTSMRVEPRLSLRVNELTAAVLRAQIARYNVLRTRILAVHEAVVEALTTTLDVEIIPCSDGDIPFTVLFKRPSRMRYPSLADSGWHVAANVPWLASTMTDSAKADAAVAITLDHLAATSAIGAGFVDP
ncbi:MAG TPA: aminotransferase class V-fold PLP-dependent enzyme, partial [Nitrospiraceae bacterium]